MGKELKEGRADLLVCLETQKRGTVAPQALTLLKDLLLMILRKGLVSRVPGG